ncbi:hypothetical protein B0H13DRAFT_1892972 [Mycena leptocephala]|nr:hypothetical protein B0H13DRAFT_1892972 [Mycena leptocephala]
MASFDRTAWISRGKQWKDTSKEARQACRNDFNIPEHLASAILPSDEISLHALVEFPLPRVTAQEVLDTTTYFSLYAPDPVDSSMILRLRHLDMPPVKVIRRLAQEGQQAWLDGFKSVKYGHLSGDAGTHFPLLVISFWNAVIDIRSDVRKPWIGGRDWLKKQMEQKKNPQVRTHATEVTKLLSVLPWNGRKRGLSDKSPIHSLWCFFGTEWLSSTDENDMLEILRDRITSDPDLVGCVRVEPVELTTKIIKAYEGRETGDYGESRWLKSLGTDIFGQGERLITIAHLRFHKKQKHWVAIEVDGPQRLFLYGDSFGEEIPPTLRQAYQWWASQHTADALEFGTLPTSAQTDGHSCGMFSANAAEHAVYPAIPLMEQANIVTERLQMFSKLANRILDRIADEGPDERHYNSDSDSEPEVTHKPTKKPLSFTELAQAAKFTFKVSPEEAQILKRPKGHPDGPTPASSPEKKRIRESSPDRSPPPGFEFNPRKLALATHTPLDMIDAASDVFGSASSTTRVALDFDDTGPLDEGKPKQTKLGSFFKVATQEEKDAMLARNAELYRGTREVRVAREEQQKYEAKLRKRDEDRERKQKSRAGIREQKIAAGWEPQPRGRKRVSSKSRNVGRY